jgi:tRNA-binding protein
MQIDYEDFDKVDIRVGKIIEVNEFPEARKPSYKLKIDFGKGIGIKQSSVQIKHLYKKDDLMGRQVIAVINFPPKQIANFMSEVLTLGVPDKDGKVVLLIPEREVDLGARMF